MKLIKENKIFIKQISIIIILLGITLWGMPNWIENFKYTKNIEYANKKYNFISDPVSSFPSSTPNISGDRKLLSSKEAKSHLDLTCIYHLIDVIFEYRMNHLDDYQYRENLTQNENSQKYVVLPKDEFANNLFSPFTIIASEKYGNVYYLRNDFSLFLLMSENGENIYFYRGFNYTSQQEATFLLDTATLDWLLNYAKDFFRHFSDEKAEQFNPKYSYLDDSGHTYTLIDEENKLHFSYDFLYHCPCSFSIGF
ncbi:MAG: hypothetical protein HFJ37_04525 [Clostridia bacterium]|nr:hypothetical protein [Clostridia bacterium]